MAVLVSSIVLYFVANESPWLMAVSAVAEVLAAIVFGYRDASLGFAVSSGQRTQFVMVSVITLGVFTVLISVPIT